MSINGSVASFLPFTINGLTDASFSNSVLGNAIATTLQVTSATPLKLARFNADRELVSASVDESQVALLVGGNVFDGAQTILPGSSTNISNVITTAITAEAYTAASFTTAGISGYTPPLGTITGPVSGEYSIGQTANDRTIMRINGFTPTVRAWTYTFTIRCVDVTEAYLSVEQSGVQRSSAIRQFTAEDTVVSDTFTYDPTSGPIVFKIYSGSLDPWNATWSSFTLGSYSVAITAPLSAPLLAQNIVTSTISTQILSFPSVSSITSESWSVYAISTMGDPSSLGGLIFQEPTLGVGAYITGGVVGATSFRFNTLSGNAGKVVVTNGDQVMSTTINAGQLGYITALSSQAGGIGQDNTWTGVNAFSTLTSVAALRITSSASNVDYSVSVNGTDFLEFTNLLSLQKVFTDGDSFWVPNRIFCNSTIYTSDLQMGSAIYFAYGTGQQWGTTLNGGGEYVIQDDVGNTRLKLSKTTGLTCSTLNVTAVPSATPTLALGVNGSGGVVSFAVPSAGGTVNTSTTTARFLPYLSTATTLTNSLLNQIDNDSIGMGYTAIPNYPLGSAKNMYVNGSIFAGGLNSMVGTFGRDTNTSNPANEITFTAGGAGTLLTQVKSHSGSSPFVDATWTYSNTTPAPLGANQGQVLLTTDKMTMSLTNGFIVGGLANIHGGYPGAVPSGFMSAGSLTIGDVLKNYGGGSNWNSNTAGLLFECLDNTEIAVHDAGARVASFMYFTSANNTFAIGRDMGWGKSDVSIARNISVEGALKLPGTSMCQIYNGYVDTYNPTGNNNLMISSWWGIGFSSYDGGVRIAFDTRTGDANFVRDLTGGSLIVNGGGTQPPGSIYSDVNWGMLFRAKVPGANSAFAFHNSVGTQLMNMTNGGILTAGQASALVIIGETAQGTIRWTNPNGGVTHWGYPSGGGSDNYIRGTMTYCDTPLYISNSDIRCTGGLPLQDAPYCYPVCVQNNRLFYTQCLQRQIYANNSVGWGGGVNMTYAFFKNSAQSVVKISGKCSYYVTGATMAYPYMRIYSQNTGVFFYYSFQAFTNNGSNHTTFPIEIVLTENNIHYNGWYDIYFYNNGNCYTDTNDQLWLNVEILPMYSF